MKDLLTIADLTRADFEMLFALVVEFKAVALLEHRLQGSRPC